jgi:hypothetical protein
MKDIYKLAIGILASLISYFPIITVINAPFYYLNNKTGVSAVVLVLVTSALQIIIGVIIISKKQNQKNLGIGIVVGALLMTLFMFFLTPMFGV